LPFLLLLLFELLGLLLQSRLFLVLPLDSFYMCCFDGLNDLIDVISSNK
jgi:hypothetical protein